MQPRTMRQTSSLAFSPGNPVLKTLVRWLVRWRILWIILIASLFLSGCVRYDVGIRFDSPYRGEIVQHIQLEERLTALNTTTAKQWLDSVEQRARLVQGEVKRLSRQELQVKIPFSNGDDLEAKFNAFFDPALKQKVKAGNGLPLLSDIRSNLKVSQSNFLLLQRNHLVYDLDLQSLGLGSEAGNLLVSPDALLTLEFGLQGPWGAGGTNARRQGDRLIWTLKPGQVNHIEANLWMPNPLGIGTVLIVLAGVAGFYLKYRTFPTAPILFEKP